MIEEFMLKANEIAATHLQSQGTTLIYRVHEQPAAESFKDFYAFARNLGFQLPATPTHRDIQKLFQEAKDSPLQAQLSVSFIRSMKLASYSPDNIGHYGLALEHYCHFTSPIRRYTDLIIQRLLFNELPEDCDLDAIALKCSEKERISFRAESSVKVLKKLRMAGTYFTEDPTRSYEASVTRIKPFALFFEVPLFDLEASLHISEIGKDYFEFNPQKMTLRGVHTGRSYSVGQMIYVRLDKINYILQQTEWSITAPPSTRPASKKAIEERVFRNPDIVKAAKNLLGCSIFDKWYKTRLDRSLVNGPGALTAALGISVSLTGAPLDSESLWIADSGLRINEFEATPRIGIDYAEECVSLPYRFVAKVGNNTLLRIAK
jgi:ribonuclease R